MHGGNISEDKRHLGNLGRMTAEEDLPARLSDSGAFARTTSAQSLNPVADSVSPAVRALTESMRDLFDALGLSLTRFSVQMHCDKGTVSRYLSGERVPPRDFIDRLFKAVHDARGALVTPEVQTVILEQYLAALEEHNPKRYQIQKISDQLLAAEEERRQRELVISALRETVAKQQDNIYALEMEKRAVEAAWATERQRTDEALEAEAEHKLRLEATIDDLRGQVIHLNARIRLEQVRASTAEKRCQMLEARLDSAIAPAEDEPTEDMPEQSPAPLAPADIPPPGPNRRVPPGSRSSRLPAPATALVSADNQTGPLYAWLYDVDQDGKSRSMMRGNRPLEIPIHATLHVTVAGGQNTPTDRFLKVPRAEEIVPEPVTVDFDPQTQYWVIHNTGRSDSLRVQSYGLSGVPLYPSATIHMTNEDVAVWIPVVNTTPRANARSEAFRLLILATGQPPQRLRRPGGPLIITAPRRTLSSDQQEAIIIHFGDHLSWPPLPAPHVRKQSEVEDIAENFGLEKEPTIQRWARSRHDALAGPIGLFTAADWFPTLGGSARSIGDHLTAFYRLVELRLITQRRVRQWVTEHDVSPYIMLDNQLLAPKRTP